MGKKEICLKLIEHLLGVFTGSHVVFVGKGSGKIVNGIKTKEQRNFADGILLFPNQLTAFFQLQITDIFFGCLIQVLFKQKLQRGSGNGKFLANLRNGKGFADGIVNIGKNPFQQFILVVLSG